MVKMSIEYEGNLHCKAKHGPSGTVISTDAPADIGGKEEAFSPTDLIGCALATCIATTLDVVAKRRGIDLKGMRVEVEKNMVTKPNRRIGSLPIQIWMPIDIAEKDRKILENSAYLCPVHQSLHPEIEMSLTFHWL